MRVAVTQFATTLNVQENLATCIKIINGAAVCEPSLIVLPELCNTQFLNAPLNSMPACNMPAGYEDHNQAWNEALFIEGYFLQAIAEQAKKHNCYIVANVSVRRDDCRDHQNSSIKSNISITSCLFLPDGELIHQEDKQTLTEHEANFFTCIKRPLKTVITSQGCLGMLVGNDDVTFEKPRDLALQGAQLLCHSMNTFLLDQSQIHGPARAGENKVFLASANKIGPLTSQEITSKENMVQELNTISPECFIGVGQSQIVSPDGNVLAKIDHNKEGFIFADIDLLNTNNKVRPDGTQLIKQRRPELYQALIPHSNSNETSDHKVPSTANVAIFATYKTNEQAIDDVCHYIENNLSDIIQLPELFFIADKSILNDAKQRIEIECLSQQLINQVSAELRPYQYVCTSLIIEGVHQAVIISEQGLFATQQQLHFCERYHWTVLGDELKIIELPLEQGSINVAMFTADDANIPESVNVAALNKVHVLLVPFDIQEFFEAEYSLISRAAEHRICIVAASREKSFTNNVTYKLASDEDNMFSKNKSKTHKSTGIIINLTSEPAQHSAHLSQWKLRKFNGYSNQPIVKYQHGKITKAVIHPVAACNKLTAK